MGLLIENGADLNIATKTNENNALIAALIEGKHWCLCKRHGKIAIKRIIWIVLRVRKSFGASSSEWYRCQLYDEQWPDSINVGNTIR